MNEEPHRLYWRALYPECAKSDATVHWYSRWKTREMAIGLYGERQQARHRWIATGPRRGREESHVTEVVTFHASPVRLLSARVCLTCLWISRDLDEEHPGPPDR